MTGAMYAAIAGLKTHMSKMNVIGNNIANVNTAGYKSQRTMFKDSIYVTSTSGSNGTSVVGGRNPSQVGYGSMVSSIDINMGDGNYAPGKASDCMIRGDGFFMVGDKGMSFANSQDLKKLTLTRVGDFDFRADSYLTDGNGSVVYGFMCVGKQDVSGEPIFSNVLTPLRLPKQSIAEDGTVEIHWPEAAENGNTLVDSEPDGDDEEWPFAQLTSITIDQATGRITGIMKDGDGEIVTVGYIAIANATNPNGVTHTNGYYYKAMDGAGELKVSVLGGAAKEMILENDTAVPRDAGFFISTGQDTDEGDETMRVGDGGGTALLTGGLETSNVDLATEISEMITTQRGYQANTRIVTVTDTMLEELVNMKRG